MSDLTDSYCERCGARYVFGPPTPKTLSLKGARLLAKGLKNFVLTDGQSMADSLTLARNDDEHVGSARITEAFHRTFNFCMTCRQYACDRCWNTRAGACLSCSPEPGFEPVAPEDHLIVRTPVARWDADWSLFPDGPAVEPLTRPALPEPFNAPIRFSEPEPAPEAERTIAQEAPISEVPTPAAWPIADLPAEAPAVPAAPGARGGHRAYHKPVDQEAASLWPMADEIAPEMTLTPEELELVEYKLARGESQADLEPYDEPALEPIDLAASAAPPAAQQAPVAEPSGPVPWPSDASAWATATTPMPEPGVVEPITPTRTVEPAAPQPQASSQPQVQEPMREPEHEPVYEHTPIVGRLLGRHAQQIETPASAQPHRPNRKGQPAGDPWPHVTQWSDRPIRAQDWRGVPDTTVQGVAPATSPVSATPEPVRVFSTALSQAMADSRPQESGLRPHQSEPNLVDARAAAAARLSAVLGEGTQPGPAAELASVPVPAQVPVPVPAQVSVQGQPAQPTPPAASPTRHPTETAKGLPQPSLFDLQPKTPTVARPDFADAMEARRGSFGQPADAPPPWQPLGSSWPAAQDPKEPWAGPEVAAASSLLSVVAAQQAAAPTVTEMWAQSSEEVLNRGSVRVCHHCALPVSTQARFCRRCGTQQG
jgi:hypothetical protein